ncbi:MAG: hypothetical protein JO097_05015 [Acidobacteriaceae bacterium]|nr:hypothetical protein [Acidobacteriaceae bacterium]MBV9766704.1 hypothetical protein [Acidobacteriaceae bacterium]
MNNILDQVARSRSSAHYGAFAPATPAEYFALRLAERLNDQAAARHYVQLVNQYSQEPLLIAYRRASQNAAKSDLTRNFHTELDRLADRNYPSLPRRRLAAIRIERRAIAIVILAGDDLEYPPLIRQLPSDGNKALGSSAIFLERILEKCSFRRAALEMLPSSRQDQRHQLTEIVSGVLRDRGVVIWQVGKRDVISSFGYPPLRFRKQVREVIAAMWPDVNGSFGGPLIKDALALGLYCQTEQLFSAES